jgi:hypothetical protein
MYVYMYIYMYTYTYLYVCEYVYLYVFMYTHSFVSYYADSYMHFFLHISQLHEAIPEKEKKKKLFRGPRVWATTIVRPSVRPSVCLSVGENRFHILRPGKLLSRAL